MSNLLFISHKHADAEIAKVIAKFIKEKSGGRVVVHLSSDPAYRGPKPGSPLIPQLKSALREVKALILIYTSSDMDWSYCMWECGLANASQDPDPKMKQVFENTFAVVGERATLAAAKEAMSSIDDCRDVFVTPGGGKDEAVLGLLTNVDMTGDS